MTRRICRIFVMMVLPCLTLACGGGGGNGGSAGVSDQLSSGASFSAGNPFDLPMSGSARYAGDLTLNLPTPSGRDVFTGRLGLNVDFDAAAGAITGEANTFIDPDGAALAGRIMITDGRITRSAAIMDADTFAAFLSGTLRSDQFHNLEISGTMLGDFSGEQAKVIDGLAFGDVLGSNGIDIFDGSFSVAAQDP